MSGKSQQLAGFYQREAERSLPKAVARVKALGVAEMTRLIENPEAGAAELVQQREVMDELASLGACMVLSAIYHEEALEDDQ